MARQMTVELIGDADRLSRTMKDVAADAKTMANKVDDQAGRVRHSFDKMGDGADASEGKFMGMADLLDGLGGAFGLPTDAATGMMRSFGDLSGGFATLQPLIGGIGTALKTGLAPAFSLIAAHPLIFALIGLAAIFVLLWKNSETFRDIVKDVFEKVGNVIGGVWNWVKDNWPLLLAILTGPIGIAVQQIITHWDTIKNAFTAVKDWIGERIGDIVGFITGIPGRIASVVSTMWDGIKTAFTAVKDWIWNRLADIVGFYVGMPARIATAALGMFDGVKDAFKNAINWIVDKWNNFSFTIGGNTFDLPGPLGKVTIPSMTLNTPDLPKLAEGGIVTRPTLALVGERGPEAVVPLRSGMGGPTFNIEFNAPMDRAGVARELEQLFTDFVRQGGVLRFTG